MSGPLGVRQFESGANRDTDSGKYDYHGFLSPQVLEKFAAYMHSNRRLPDGTLRAGDNWKKGFPREVIFASLARHFFDLWMIEETGHVVRPETGQEVDIHDALGGLFFNVQALWLDELRCEGAARVN